MSQYPPRYPNYAEPQPYMPAQAYVAPGYNPAYAYTLNAETKQSGMGVASFLLSIAACAVFVLAIGLVGADIAARRAGHGAPFLRPAGLLLLLTPLLALIGLILGIAGTAQSDRKRGLAIVGALVNGVLIMMFMGILALGLAVRHHRRAARPASAPPAPAAVQHP